MFYRNEETYLGVAVLEQSYGVLDLGEGDDQWHTHDQAWDVWQDYMMQRDCIGDLTGYLI